MPSHAPLLVATLTAAVLSGPALAVVGGRPVQVGDPARAFTLRVTAGAGQMCSAAAIEPDLILTAAHCLARGGRIAVTSIGMDGQSRRHPVAGFAIHQSFVSGLHPHRQPGVDLALIRLAQELPADMRPISRGSGPWDGEALSLAGFGLGAEGRAGTAHQLRQADLVSVGAFAAGNTVAMSADPASLGMSMGAGACRGDSGGPIFRSNGALVGIVSWSSGPIKQDRRRVCGGMTSFTPVSGHDGWISETAGRLRRGETQVAPARYASGQGR